MQEENQIRSFIVLMDKNKDTQWLEDGKFVDNPLTKPYTCPDTSFQDALGILCGIDYIKDVSVDPYNKYAVYTVEGYKYSTPSLVVKRKVTINYT